MTAVDQTPILDSLFKTTPTFLAVLDCRGAVLRMSQYALDAGGLGPEDMAGRPLWEGPWWRHDPETAARMRYAIESASDEVQSCGIVSFCDNTGALRYTRPVIHVGRDAGGAVETIFFHGHDTTAEEAYLQEREEAVAASETMVRETHHRVMNSLAMVSSIIRHERSRNGDREVHRTLDRLKARISAISTLYRTLSYRPAGADWVHAPTYVEGVISEVAAAILDGERTRIGVSSDIADLRLPAEAAVPIGLILNELMTNCVKYAFPEGGDGTIHVALVPDGAALRLTVTDDGIGSEDPVIAGEGLGGRLVEAFAQQLDGTVRQSPNPGGGTRIEVTIGAAALARRGAAAAE